MAHLSKKEVASKPIAMRAKRITGLVNLCFGTWLESPGVK